MGDWYSYDPDDGYEEHDTEAEARAAAERALDYCRAESTHDGWSEDTGRIVWGRVMGRAVETVTHEHGPECRTGEGCVEGCSMEWDYIASFDIVEVTRGE